MFQLFIVFHNKLFEECYTEIPDELLQKYVTFIAVNPSIKKEFIRKTGESLTEFPDRFKILNEWDLSKYDETLQTVSRFNENSALHHIYVNGLHEQYRFLGFGQYDMRIPLSALQQCIDFNDESGILSLQQESEEFSFVKSWLPGHKTPFELMKLDYHRFNGKVRRSACQLPLLNTYVISSTVFGNLMRWIVQLHGKTMLYFKRWNIMQVYASFLERAMGYGLGQQGLTVYPLTFDHDHAFKRAAAEGASGRVSRSL